MIGIVVLYGGEGLVLPLFKWLVFCQLPYVSFRILWVTLRIYSSSWTYSKRSQSPSRFYFPSLPPPYPSPCPVYQHLLSPKSCLSISTVHSLTGEESKREWDGGKKEEKRRVCCFLACGHNTLVNWFYWLIVGKLVADVQHRSWVKAWNYSMTVLVVSLVFW